MAWVDPSVLLSFFIVVPTRAVALNVIFVIALLSLPGLMVWLDRRGSMPTALPWGFLLAMVPMFAYSMVMISFQPNSYCNNILPHAEFRAFYVLFLPFLPLLAHMVGSNKVGRPWLFGSILTLSLLFVFDMTVGHEVLHMVYQNQTGEGVVYSGARAWECNHYSSTSMQVAFRAKWRANQVFLLLMPLMLIGARLVHRRRRGNDASQNEKSEV